MNRDAVQAAVADFLTEKGKVMEIELAIFPDSLRQIAEGWVFSYQSLKFIETGDVWHSLVGHGPVVILDDGRILEGGSLHHDHIAVLRHYGVIA